MSFWSQTTSVRYENLTWDQAQFSFRFVNNIPVAVRENVWEPLKFGLISGYENFIGIRISFLFSLFYTAVRKSKKNHPAIDPIPSSFY